MWRIHANHVERNIWRHDFKHVETYIVRILRKASEAKLEMMWRTHVNHVDNSFEPYGDQHTQKRFIPCGQFLQTMWSTTCGEMMLKTTCNLDSLGAHNNVHIPKPPMSH